MHIHFNIFLRKCFKLSELHVFLSEMFIRNGKNILSTHSLSVIKPALVGDIGNIHQLVVQSTPALKPHLGPHPKTLFPPSFLE